MPAYFKFWRCLIPKSRNNISHYTAVLGNTFSQKSDFSSKSSLLIAILFSICTRTRSELWIKRSFQKLISKVQRRVQTERFLDMNPSNPSAVNEKHADQAFQSYFKASLKTSNPGMAHDSRREKAWLKSRARSSIKWIQYLTKAI
jgi:hypothetical protein